MSRAGSRQPEALTILAGTPATVTWSGTFCSTTEPEATREQRPIRILPRIFAPAPIEHAVADLGMAVARDLAGSPERHLLHERDIVAHRRRLADDEPRRVIEKDAAAEGRRRVDVGLEHFRRAALQIERELAPAVSPQPMGEPMRLHRVKTLEMQERLEQPRAGRIALDDGREIGAEGRDQRRLGGDRAEIGVGDRLGGNDGAPRRAAMRRTIAWPKLSQLSTAPVSRPASAGSSVMAALASSRKCRQSASSPAQISHSAARASGRASPN